MIQIRRSFTDHPAFQSVVDGCDAARRLFRERMEHDSCMHMELTLNQSMLIIFLDIVALGGFNTLLYFFALNRYIINLITGLEEFDECSNLT